MDSYFYSKLFFVLYFPRRYQWFFPFFVNFWEKKITLQHRVIVPEGQQRILSAQSYLALFNVVHAWMGYQIRLRHVKCFFFLFFSFSLDSDVSKLPVMYNVFFLFINYFVKISLHCVCIHFWRIHLQYCIKYYRNVSFEFSSIFLSVNHKKLLITAWIIFRFRCRLRVWWSSSNAHASLL